MQERASYDRQEIYRILDEGLVCHVGFVVDRQPFVIPMSYARDADRLILHGSPAGRLMQTLGAGCEACVTVTLVDGIVLARAASHHTMNYRSVVLFGIPRMLVSAQEKREALEKLLEYVIPGRAADVRPASAAEIDATAVLEFPLHEASAMARGGPPMDEAQDMQIGVWAGVIPLRQQALDPVPDAHVKEGIGTPAYAATYDRCSRQ
jgi:nitroimidazol reductase NimA-like FMN-containing flavoprotein (pyridoxamine 5'-phosphate oxidase superfamily)